MTRTRNIFVEASWGGTCNDPLRETEVCGAHPCPPTPGNDFNMLRYSMTGTLRLQINFPAVGWSSGTYC